jgi:hypothetical protein
VRCLRAASAAASVPKRTAFTPITYVQEHFLNIHKYNAMNLFPEDTFNILVEKLIVLWPEF